VYEVVQPISCERKVLRNKPKQGLDISTFVDCTMHLDVKMCLVHSKNHESPYYNMVEKYTILFCRIFNMRRLSMIILAL
jgi:hypothetical protein